jgi:uncharacterized protein (TIGR03086 family)
VIDMDMRELYRGCVGFWSEQVSRVDNSSWSLPTPCADWDVRTLINHLVGEERWSRPLLEGKTIAEVGDAFAGDVLGAEPLKTALEAEYDSVLAVDALFPGITTVHLSYGDEKAENYLWQLTSDHLIHAWDLGTALGRSVEMPHSAVEAVADWFAEWEPRYREAGLIAERAASDGTPQGDLLAAFGRATG